MTNSPDFSIPVDNNSTSTPISHERFHRLRRIAFWSCIISVVFDIAFGLTAFVNCMRTRSFVGFSYSVHALMDSLCESFVAWHLTAKSIDDVNRRDRLACCVIGALFIGSFLAIETRAIQSMMLPPTVRPDMTVVIYSLIYIIVFTILSIIKMTISKQIKSTALKFDTINSIIGIIMVLPLIVWDRVVFINKFTHIDDLVQVLMVLFLFVAGGKLIVDSITIMNADYARNLREKKLQKMLKESDDNLLERFNSGSYIVGT
ncbi:unnamed protein product [Rotaria magnacalcarata]|uniref:Cation efflux protein transmembrane domain-containing protein n=4 Tax=Rotaria magnacalcarata TaxID=392030 RepID=A0A819FVL3_9BILA|nr:unnamed protein product [Rotaria magnacalcarata]CAF3874727.1 unnamed protein product [Rotaria magnacalcarata]